MPTSVQFFGREAVLQAFDNSDCSNWSILQARQFMFKYEGASKKEAYDNLNNMLKMIEDSGGSEATYELRTYDLGDQGDEAEAEGTTRKKVPAAKKRKQEPKRKIYASTDYDGSFNFKLFDQGGNMSPKRMQYQENLQLRGEVDQLKKTVQELMKELQEGDEKETGIAGMFNSLLDQPEMRTAIVGRVVQLFDRFTSKIGTRANHDHAYDQDRTPAQVAGPALDPIPEPKPQEINLSPQQARQLNEAVAVLVRADPAFCEHLYKLAQIASSNPGTYKTLIDMLQKM